VGARRLIAGAFTTPHEGLNYQDFMCLGILRGDLNEEMLRYSIRSIMCNYVEDFADVIEHTRTINSKSFSHLCHVYNRWRNPGKPAIGTKLGSS